MIAAGKSHEYAEAYASKIRDGEVFARHFAIIRERRFLAKKATEQVTHTLDTSVPIKALLKADTEYPSPSPSPSVAAAAAGVGALHLTSAATPAAATTSSGASAPSAPPAATPRPLQRQESEDVLRSPAPGHKREPSIDVTTAATTAAEATGDLRRRTPQDFVFKNVLGEGAYSTVLLAVEKETSRKFAVKILEKDHIKKEKKTKYVMTEKEALNKLHKHPFIVRLYYTFQDPLKLYFVLTYCSNGELLRWIRKLSSFDLDCTRFYAAELTLALEHMHALGIIHRDLKPENILLDDNMHMKVTDFGTAKLLGGEDDGRANSFVGTAQYVSPELLEDKITTKSSDLWALGCIIYQLLSGGVPFPGGNEYQTFKLIREMTYKFPTGFPEVGENLVRQLLVRDPDARVGCEAVGGFRTLKQHAFFAGVEWETLHQQKPPQLDAYLPPKSADEKGLHGIDGMDDDSSDLAAAMYMQQHPSSVDIKRKKDEERQQLLARQAKDNPWHKYVNPNELIIKHGPVDKRKGLFSKRRQLILTDTPRLLYVDAEACVVKGEIPWTEDMFPQFKTMSVFFVHTPLRTYYLEDVERAAITWVDTLQQMLRMYKADLASRAAAAAAAAANN